MNEICTKNEGWMVAVLAAGLFFGCNDDAGDNSDHDRDENTAVACSDRIDNDGDGAVDCDDPECAQFCGCDAGVTLDGGVLDLLRLRVDLLDRYRPVTHAASGSLYGLADEDEPSIDLVRPLGPFMFTQMAPGGDQHPVGDALKVAALAGEAGATITIRMPDIYRGFPYSWVSLEDWLGKVDGIVADTLAAAPTNLYGYEIWNEPDYTWKTDEAGPFDDVWKQTFDRIRAVDPNTRIIGPSIAKWNEIWMRRFLTFALENNCMPDIICWHELGAPEGYYVDDPRPEFIPTHVAAYRELEISLGIGPLPISINEYGVQIEEGVPGGMIRYIAHFEREGVESANIAFWFQPGRLSDLLTWNGAPNGGWWFYKFYGDMAGQMAMSYREPDVALDLDGIGSVDEAGMVVSVVFGGADGDRAIVIEGFDGLPFFHCEARVIAESVPWTGRDGAVEGPTTMFDETHPIIDGVLAVRIPDMNRESGYRLVITPM